MGEDRTREGRQDHVDDGLGDRMSRLEEQVGFGELGQGRLSREVVELSRILAELVDKVERLEARVRAVPERREEGEGAPGPGGGPAVG